MRGLPVGSHGGDACNPHSDKRDNNPWGLLCRAYYSSWHGGSKHDGEGSPRALSRGRDGRPRARPFQSSITPSAEDLGKAPEDHHAPSSLRQRRMGEGVGNPDHHLLR
jgi:hypothetical protein